jgi:hypothetical protein
MEEATRDPVLDWRMASTRPHFANIKRDHWGVQVLRPITTISSQPLVQDNESTDPHLSRDREI